MRLGERQQALDSALLDFRDLWHPQPFRESRPQWCEHWPSLMTQVMGLSDAETSQLSDDGSAGLALISRHVPGVAKILPLVDLPVAEGMPLADRNVHWAWEIPGRKRAQIEAFAAAAGQGRESVIDWCGGKGHLGRLLALAWHTPVHTLEIDPVLCSAGETLARRAGASQEFVVSDALATTVWPQAGQHAVALHACGDLHRRLISEGVRNGVAAFDIAPCCYYRGVTRNYQPLSDNLQLTLTRDDTRLAVTETVTSSPRETRQRDRAIAWKLGFDAFRRTVEGNTYRTFKPVPEPWLRSEFADFLERMAAREGLPAPSVRFASEFEARGWQRHGEVMRLAVVRHAFRRAIEIWLALDLACFLEGQGYAVGLASFCERHLTPRNLLISAKLV